MSLTDVHPALVAEFGQSVTVAWPTGTPANATIQAIVQRANRSIVDGIAVLASDRQVTIAGSALAAAPEVGGLVTIDSVGFRIVQVFERRASGSILGWLVVLRGAA